LGYLLVVLGVTAGTSAIASAQAIDVFRPDADGYVYAVAVQPDGKIVVGGDFTMFGCNPNCGPSSVARQGLARLNADGTLDSTFNPGVNGPIYGIVVQPDGAIVIGGSFSGVGGGTGTTPRKYLARLNNDGTVDMGFDPGVNMNNYVEALALQPDGKILVGGGFYAGLGGAVRYFLGRLNPDGTADAGFSPGADGAVSALALQPDGKILVGGLFGYIGGEFGDTPRSRIARLNSDGSVDAGFDPGADFLVNVITVQADGKILVGGNFTTLGGGGTGTTPRAKIGRLNANGTLDTGFDPGANGFVYTLGVQTDGRILVGGDFTMLGGGGTGATSRNFLGRLNASGTIDSTFNPGADGGVYGLTIQPDGKVIVGGAFYQIGGGTGTTPRRYVGRILNSGAAPQSITVTGGGSVITWLRGGTSPELMRAEFATSTDGVNYTPLGAGVRVAGGWQLTGQSLTVDPNRTIRARGYYATAQNGASSSIAESIVPMSEVNIVENGNFGNSTTHWQFFATPDLSYIVTNVTAGVLQYYRVPPPQGTTNQAVAFQQTGVAIMSDAGIHAQFDLGNSSSVRKRVSVLILDASFTDLSVCTFWIPPNTPLTTFQMNTHTTKPWTNASIYFYAATAGSDGGFYRIDNVVMQYSPGVSNARTDCIDPFVPAPAGADGPDLLVNGDFNTGVLTPWLTFGQITGQITGGVFEFIKNPGAPAGVVFQLTNQAMTAKQIVLATLQLGNSSSVRKRVTVILHDSNFTDLTACTFWLAPGQPLSDYWIRGYATQAQANFTLSVYPATVGADQWILLDNATVRRTGSGTVGTECVEPGGGAPVSNNGPQAAPQRAISLNVGATSGSAWIADGFSAIPELLDSRGPAFAARAESGSASTLRTNTVIDLTTASAAALSFASWLKSADAVAEVQVSVGGGEWVTVAAASESNGWQTMDIDLTDFVGHVIEVRFVFEPDAAESRRPEAWLLRALQVHITKGR
jgi:uncharacterized delta-60 repeat protein